MSLLFGPDGKPLILGKDVLAEEVKSTSKTHSLDVFPNPNTGRYELTATTLNSNGQRIERRVISDHATPVEALKAGKDYKFPHEVAYEEANERRRAQVEDYVDRNRDKFRND